MKHKNEIKDNSQSRYINALTHTKRRDKIHDTTNNFHSQFSLTNQHPLRT